MISFTSRLSVAASMVFDACYEDALRMSAEEKAPILAGGIVVWLTVDGVLAGETYGISPRSMMLLTGERIEDCDPADDASLYCYSTTVLPRFRGYGFAKLLKAYWLGQATEAGYQRVIGHSTAPAIAAPAIAAINEFFGARHVKTHDRWYGTDRTAHFYTLPLDISAPRQRTVWDCGLAAVEFLVRLKGRAPLSRREALDLSRATPADGCSHEDVVRLLRASGLEPKEATTDVPFPPSIVNYQWEGDGHYGVLVGRADGVVRIYNPGTGYIDEMVEAAFIKSFWSARYGRNWSVSA